MYNILRNMYFLYIFYIHYMIYTNIQETLTKSRHVRALFIYFQVCPFDPHHHGNALKLVLFQEGNVSSESIFVNISYCIRRRSIWFQGRMECGEARPWGRRTPSPSPPEWSLFPTFNLGGAKVYFAWEGRLPHPHRPEILSRGP